jgi:hypothetical protein
VCSFGPEHEHTCLYNPKQKALQESFVNFPGFMEILYFVCNCMPGASLQGSYLPPCANLGPQVFVPATIVQEVTFETKWQQVHDAYSVFEADFALLDRDSDNLIQYKDLSETYFDLVYEDKHSSFSRLHKAFFQVDLDHSNSLNFREYLLFAFTLSQEGAYREVVRVAQDACKVKNFLLDVLTFYRHVTNMRVYLIAMLHRFTAHADMISSSIESVPTASNCVLVLNDLLSILLRLLTDRRTEWLCIVSSECKNK